MQAAVRVSTLRRASRSCGEGANPAYLTGKSFLISNGRESIIRSVVCQDLQSIIVLPLGL